MDEIFSILNCDHEYYLNFRIDENTTQRQKYKNEKLQADKAFETMVNIKFEKLRNNAASVIQRAWKRYEDRKIFKFLKSKVKTFSEGDPRLLLRRVNQTESLLFDKITAYCLRFKLGGEKFPPAIMYKIFRKRKEETNNYLGIRECGNKPGNVKEKSLDWKVFFVYKRAKNSRVRRKYKSGFSVLLDSKRRIRRSKKNNRLSWISKIYD